MRRYILEKRKKLVEDTAREVAPEIYAYLILSVAYGWTFWQLQSKGVPSSKNTFYTLRRRFYYELSKRI